METTNGYVVHYNGKQYDVYAKTLNDAKKQFVSGNKVPMSKWSVVSVTLAEKDVPIIDGKPGKGTQVIHIAN
jgi:hypothetical protein